MAGDNLNQLGHVVKTNQDQVRHVTRRIAENYPQVERTLDIIGAQFPYMLEFYTYKVYGTINRIYLHLQLAEVFDPNAIQPLLDIPITITATGLSVGNDGFVGSQNVWYALAYFGDLNFAIGDTFSVVFDITTQGTNLSAFKVSFNEGEVDITSNAVITGTNITVTINAIDVLNTGQTIIHNVYIYSKVLTFGSASDWIYYTAYTTYMNGVLYTPRTAIL